MHHKYANDLEDKDHINEQLYIKLEKYSSKIKELYEALIKEKKKATEGSVGSHHNQDNDDFIYQSLQGELNPSRRGGAVLSHREVEEGIHTETHQSKKYASPSYYSVGKRIPSARRWQEQNYPEYLRELEAQGEEAFYRGEGLKEIGGSQKFKYQYSD